MNQNFMQNLTRIRGMVTSYKENYETLFKEIASNKSNKMLQESARWKTKVLRKCDDLKKQLASVEKQAKNKIPVSNTFFEDIETELKELKQNLYLRGVLKIFFGITLKPGGIYKNIEKYGVRFLGFSNIVQCRIGDEMNDLILEAAEDNVLDCYTAIRFNINIIEYNLYHNNYNFSNLMDILKSYTNTEKEMQSCMNSVYKKMLWILAKDFEEYDKFSKAIDDLESSGVICEEILIIQCQIIRETILRLFEEMKNMAIVDIDYPQFLTLMEVLRMSYYEMMLYSTDQAMVEEASAYEPRVPSQEQSVSVIAAYMMEELDFTTFVMIYLNGNISKVYEKKPPKYKVSQFNNMVIEKAQMFLSIYRRDIKQDDSEFFCLKNLWMMKRLKSTILKQVHTFQKTIHHSAALVQAKIKSINGNKIPDLIDSYAAAKPIDPFQYIIDNEAEINPSKRIPLRNINIASSSSSAELSANLENSNEVEKSTMNTTSKSTIMEAFKMTYQASILGANISLFQPADLQMVKDMFGLDNQNVTNKSLNVTSKSLNSPKVQWKPNPILDVIKKTSVPLLAFEAKTPIMPKLIYGLPSPVRPRILLTGDAKLLSVGPRVNQRIPRIIKELKFKPEYSRYPLFHTPTTPGQFRASRRTDVPLSPIERDYSKLLEIVPRGEIIPLDIPMSLFQQPWEMDLGFTIEDDENITDWSFVSEVSDSSFVDNEDSNVPPLAGGQAPYLVGLNDSGIKRKLYFDVLSPPKRTKF